jgi:putative ABC transport system permease protein
MGIKEIKVTNNNIKSRRVKNLRAPGFSSTRTPIVYGSLKKKHKSKNIKQIFILSFDALKERKARSALTILMVVVGSGLMIALNGMSAGQSNFLNKQLNTLAPDILFVSSGQRGFSGGPEGSPTIVFNTEIVNRLKSLPFVKEVVPSYTGQLQLNAQGNILNSQIIAMKPQKIYLINPSLQLVESSTIRPNDPSAMLVGDSIANPPGKSAAFVTVGQTVRAIFAYVDPNTGKAKEQDRFDNAITNRPSSSDAHL